MYQFPINISKVCATLTQFQHPNLNSEINLKASEPFKSNDNENLPPNHSNLMTMKTYVLSLVADDLSVTIVVSPTSHGELKGHEVGVVHFYILHPKLLVRGFFRVTAGPIFKRCENGCWDVDVVTLKENSIPLNIYNQSKIIVCLMIA